MSALRGRWWQLAIASGLLALVLGGIAFRRLSRPRPWFTYSNTPLSQSGLAALAAQPGWSKSLLEMPDGVTLAGLIRPTPSSDAPWVMFFPGNDHTQLAGGQSLLERIRGDHDWGLAVYASRGYDASGGAPSPAHFAEDAQRVYSALLEQQRLKPSQVHLVAFSLGGYGALHAVHEAAGKQRAPASLSLLASVARVAMIRNGFLARLGAGDVYDVLPLLPETPGPVLVIEGGADEAFKEAPQGKLLARGLGERGRYVELPGVGHVSLLQSEQAVSTVRTFIEQQAQRASQ